MTKIIDGSQMRIISKRIGRVLEPYASAHWEKNKRTEKAMPYHMFVFNEYIALYYGECACRCSSIPNTL